MAIKKEQLSNDISFGTGSGDINYLQISNKPHNAEAALSGFNTYKNTVQPRPVNGTGGSPTIINPVSITSVAPLSGSKSFLLSKNVGNAQGEGWSIDFQIERNVQVKILNIRFDYILQSGSFVAGTVQDYSTAGDSDLIVYIYDIGNDQLIEPTTFRLYSNSTSIPETFIGSFQTNSNSLNYRLIFHVARNSTPAWSLKIDNIQITPTKYNTGAIITDWVDFPSTAIGTLITATGSNPSDGGSIIYHVAQWRRVGSNMEIRWQLSKNIGGSNGSGVYLFNLPPGYDIDIARFGQTGLSDEQVAVGWVKWHDYGSYIGIGYASIYDSKRLRFAFITDTGKSYWSSSWGIFNDEQRLTMYASVPIAGWSSSVKISEPLENRDIIFRARRSGSNQSLTAGVTNVALNDILLDTANGWDSTNNIYRVPVSGHYVVLGGLAASSSSTYWDIYVNNAFFSSGHNRVDETNQTGGICAVLPNLKAGDQISIRPSINTNLVAHSALYVVIYRLPSPQTLAQSESVVMMAYNMSSLTIPDNNWTNFTGWTKNLDTHSCFNASAGIFTAPMPGAYLINAQFILTSSSSGGAYTMDASIISGSGINNACIASINNLGTNFSFLIYARQAGTQFQLRVGAWSVGGSKTIRNLYTTDCTLSIVSIK